LPFGGAEKPEEVNGPPHISHSRSQGWFTKVHLGHDIDAVGFTVLGFGEEALLWGKTSAPKPGTDVSVEVPSRVVAAVMAAFNTVVKGGFMPHARQGGVLLDAVAVDGSKLEGTGLEKEHIGQIQVAFRSVDADGFKCGTDVCISEDCNLG
jgi:hypothetical protein